MTLELGALAGLDDEQRRAAETLFGPVCILAGAGTGKTRTLTHRIAHGIESGAYPAGSVLALAFTSKAAAELRHRLRVLQAPGAVVRTFHAEALAQLSHFWPDVVGGALPRLLDNKGRVIGEAAEVLRIQLGAAAIRDVAAEIEWRKTSELSLEDYPSRARDRPMPRGLDLDAVTEIQAAYEALKDERRRVDFEDVLLIASGLLDSEPVARDRVRAQYRTFVVDEYQDVSPLQHRLLDIWLGDRRDLCVVGDASQTIYTFAGASSDYLLGFARRHPDAEVVRLERNYRSAAAVLDLANRLVQGRPGALRLRSATGARGTVSAPAAHDDDAIEAAAIAAAVRREIDGGTSPENIAVLYRVNEQATAIDAALAERGIVTRLLSGPGFFDLPAIRRVMSVLAVDAQRFPDAGVPETVADAARGAGWTLSPDHGSLSRSDWAALDGLVRFAESTPDDVGLARFVSELEDRESTKGELPMRAVVLATLHGAKGLEWDSVHIAGLSEGLIPVVHARGAAAIDEERRLLYVGITRARRRLSLSWARQGARGRLREPSRFLAELRSDTTDAATTRSA
jgi:DNA helicase-2/ATP-dependent DNA helicase PcrA